MNLSRRDKIAATGIFVGLVALAFPPWNNSGNPRANMRDLGFQFILDPPSDFGATVDLVRLFIELAVIAASTLLALFVDSKRRE